MAAEQTEDFFGPVAVDDLQTGDPLKQIPALSKLIYSAGRGKDVTHYFDLVAKTAFVPAADKSVKRLGYSSLKYFRLSPLQWERVTAFILNDLRSTDLDVRIAAMKSLEVLPSASLSNLLETTKVISQASFVDSQRPDEAAAVRACAVHLLTTLLIYRKSVRNNNNFNLSAWSMITERILSDPSRKVFRAALSAVNMLLSDVMGGASFCNNGLSQNTDPHDKALFSKYARVVLTKLVPHVDLILKRIQWADNDSKVLAPFVVACLLTHIVDVNYTNTTPKLAFLTSPRHFLIEVVELDMMPFLHSREEALVFEAARSIIFVSQRSDVMKPSWIFAVCRSLMGLLSRDSCRSVATEVVSLLLDGVELLPASLLLGVCIRVFQQLSILSLASSRTYHSGDDEHRGLHSHTGFHYVDMRLYFVQRLMNTLVKQSIKEQTRQQGGSHIGVAGKLFDDLIKSSWMQEMLDHTNEDQFAEEILACMMRAVAQTFLEAASSLTEAVDSGVSPQALNDAKETYREWRQILIALTSACAKCCGWKTHMRTFLQESYIKLVDTAGFALQSPSKRDRERLTDLLNGIADYVVSLRHDPLCLRLIFVLLKHSPPVAEMRKLVDSLHSLMQQRFLGSTSAPAQAQAAPSQSSATGHVARQLGYRVDQLKKSNLSATDTETLYICLAMEAAHPASDITDPGRRMFLIGQMKTIATQRSKLDPSLAHRLDSILNQVQSSSTSSTEILPISRQIFYPPVEYLDKNIVEKVPDDDFIINFSKAKHKLDARLAKTASSNGDDRVASVLGIGLLQNAVTSKKRAATIKPVSSSERIHCLTSPSDPFLVTARFEVGEDKRLKIFFQLTNLTRFAVPKLTLTVNVSGRLDVSSESNNVLEFENISPSQYLETTTTMRIQSFAGNTVTARITLVPAADKPNATLEINCVPHRLNMHELIRPWILDTSEFLKQWSRVSTTFQFKAFVSERSLVRTLNEKLYPFYNCALHWNHAGDTFYSEAFAGLTFWDETILFTVNGTMTELGGVVLRFEIRASSLSLSVILDTHKEVWLNDLFGENIRLLEDANLAGESAKTLFDVTRPSLSKRGYDEDKLLGSWADIRRSVPV